MSFVIWALFNKLRKNDCSAGVPAGCREGILPSPPESS
jgi:hypothetical protein